MEIRWTEDRTALLKKLLTDGYSYSQIAKELRTVRNAVAGKISRLGIKNIAPVKLKKHRLRIKNIAPVKLKPKPAKVLAPTPHIMLGDNALFIFEIVENPVRLLDLNRNTCRWPVAGEMFCGAQSVEGRPYCERHCDMAYRRAYERRA